MHSTAYMVFLPGRVPSRTDLDRSNLIKTATENSSLTSNIKTEVLGMVHCAISSCDLT